MTPRNEATAILKLLSYFSFATISLSATLWKPQKSLNRPWQARISISNDKSHRQRLKVFNKSWCCFVSITSGSIGSETDRNAIGKLSRKAQQMLEFWLNFYFTLSYIENMKCCRCKVISSQVLLSTILDSPIFNEMEIKFLRTFTQTLLRCDENEQKAFKWHNSTYDADFSLWKIYIKFHHSCKQHHEFIN